MCFLHPNQTGTHPAGKNSLLFFCTANTPPEICEKQNGSRARAHQKQAERTTKSRNASG